MDRFHKALPYVKGANVTLENFTPDLQKIYTDISAISVTFCNSVHSLNVLLNCGLSALVLLLPTRSPRFLKQMKGICLNFDACLIQYRNANLYSLIIIREALILTLSIFIVLYFLVFTVLATGMIPNDMIPIFKGSPAFPAIYTYV